MGSTLCKNPTSGAKTLIPFVKDDMASIYRGPFGDRKYLIILLFNPSRELYEIVWIVGTVWKRTLVFQKVRSRHFPVNVY